MKPSGKRQRARLLKRSRTLADLIAEEGHNHSVSPWDWRHYAEKLRTRKFDFNEAELKPYLAIDNIIAAAFDVANRLFGITIEERPNISGYHEDVRIFEVLNSDGSHRAVFIGDYFASSSKRSGAWMSGFQSQHRLGDAKGGGTKPDHRQCDEFCQSPCRSANPAVDGRCTHPVSRIWPRLARHVVRRNLPQCFRHVRGPGFCRIAKPGLRTLAHRS